MDKEMQVMATTTFTPLHDRILVRRTEEGETVRGGIFPLDVKAGDTILFGKYSGTEIKLDGEEFLIMREEEVLGIVSK
jgi:chaperonin GroES